MSPLKLVKLTQNGEPQKFSSAETAMPARASYVTLAARLQQLPVGDGDNPPSPNKPATGQ